MNQPSEEPSGSRKALKRDLREDEGEYKGRKHAYADGLTGPEGLAKPQTPVQFWRVGRVILGHRGLLLLPKRKSIHETGSSPVGAAALSPSVLLSVII